LWGNSIIVGINFSQCLWYKELENVMGIRQISD